jgi:hypothetical protein
VLLYDLPDSPRCSKRPRHEAASGSRESPSVLFHPAPFEWVPLSVVELRTAGNVTGSRLLSHAIPRKA